MKNVVIRSKVAMMSANFKEKFSLKSKEKGAFAFEYVIVLAIMAVVIFAAWNILGDAVMAKAKSIAAALMNQNVSDPDFGAIVLPIKSFFL